ncbi:MAG: AMP-binding protein [Candidatus Binatia bacterium]
MRTEGALPPGVERYDDVLAAHEEQPLPAVAVDPDSDAAILYTSGTTAHPKGVVSTHRAIMQSLFAFACAIALAAARPPKEPHPFPTCYILIVPLFHVTGLVPVMLGATLGGNKLVMMYKWSPERALELIERERVTTFVGVPTQSTTCSSRHGSRAPTPPACSRSAAAAPRRRPRWCGASRTASAAGGRTSATA